MPVWLAAVEPCECGQSVSPQKGLLGGAGQERRRGAQRARAQAAFSLRGASSLRGSHCAGSLFTNQGRPSPYLAQLPHRLGPSPRLRSRQAWPSSRELCSRLTKPLPQHGPVMLASCSAPLLESRHCTSTAWPAGSPHPHRLGVQKACSTQLWGHSEGKLGFPRLLSQRACVSVSACG